MHLPFILSCLAGLSVTVQATQSALVLNSDFMSSGPCGPYYCAGTNYTADEYFCGDPRLGPKVLHTSPPVGPLLIDYDRLGGICPGVYLSTWFNATGNTWNFPPHDGFELDGSGKPITTNVTLKVGVYVDRFGPPAAGPYLSPGGTPFRYRCLPPQGLSDSPLDPQHPSGYYIYQVTKEFDVMSGLVRPWFNQPGLRTRYRTYSLLPALIAEGYITEVPVNV